MSASPIALQKSGPKSDPVSAGSDAAHSKSGADVTQLVTFLLKDEEFGFDIMAVQEIIRLPKMARLPNTPEFVEGISNLRGALLPIVDIRARFGMKREPRTDHSRVLVIDIDGKRTGLLVDGVREVTRVGRTEFEPPPAAIQTDTADYIDGVVKLADGKRMIITLNARRVCAFGGVDAGESPRGHVAVGSQEAQTVAGPTVPSEADTWNGVERRQEGGTVHQLVSFQIGREEFAFPMEDVREILRVQPPKEVPSSPEHLLGVLTVRGCILPIVDLRRLMRHKTFATDGIEACRNATAQYRKWIESCGTAAQGDLQEALAASERMRQWLAEFSSSSQILMETIARVRGLNEHVKKEIGLQTGNRRAIAANKSVYEDVVATVRKILNGLLLFEEQAEKNLCEDQRIIVVDSNGFPLGLVVDHVNEVLSVPGEAIEAPPELANSAGVTLSGVAKLNDGNRLILLLTTRNLLDGRRFAEIAESLKKHAAAPAPGPDAQSATGSTVAKGPETAQKEEYVQLVTFLLDNEEYGIPIARIQEIDRLSKITKTPKAPRFVEGVTNLRGEVIPVLSTRTLFALDERKSDERARVIIVDMGGAKTGLVVDSVKEVLSIATSNIAAPPKSISSTADAHFISGIGKVNNGTRMIVLLDVARVLTHGEQGQLAQLKRAA